MRDNLIAYGLTALICAGIMLALQVYYSAEGRACHESGGHAVSIRRGYMCLDSQGRILFGY